MTLTVETTAKIRTQLADGAPQAKSRFSAHGRKDPETQCMKVLIPTPETEILMLASSWRFWLGGRRSTLSFERL